MDRPICCVCHILVDEDAPRVGTRIYCPEHYARVTHNRRSVWRSGVASIVALVIFAALVALVARLTVPALEGAGLVLAGTGLALIPAILWLVFFYSQDRLEPEPKLYVLGVFVLGALLAGAIGMPVLRDLFRVQDWLDRSLWAEVLGSILVVGFVQEFLKYAAVRYSIYPSAEFDERMDGILYGTAAGLGYATLLNIQYVVESGGVDLAMGVLRIAVTALAQASFAGVSGYFLGCAKFEDEPVWWLPAGVTLAAVLNGLFSVLRGDLIRSGSALAGRTANPWLGLVFAGVMAAAILAALFALMRRAERWAQQPVPQSGLGTGPQGA